MSRPTGNEFVGHFEFLGKREISYDTIDAIDFTLGDFDPPIATTLPLDQPWTVLSAPLRGSLADFVPYFAESQRPLVANVRRVSFALAVQEALVGMGVQPKKALRLFIPMIERNAHACCRLEMERGPDVYLDVYDLRDTTYRVRCGRRSGRRNVALTLALSPVVEDLQSVGFMPVAEPCPTLMTLAEARALGAQGNDVARLSQEVKEDEAVARLLLERWLRKNHVASD